MLLKWHKILTIVLFFIYTKSTAQQQLFLGAQSQWGMGLTSIEQKKQILKNKSIPWQINTAISAIYRIGNKFSIEAGIANNNLIWKLYDNDFKERYANRFESKIANKIGHINYFLNMQYAFKLPSSNPFSAPKFIYIQLGGGYHHYGSKTLSQQKEFVMNSELMESVNTQTTYNRGSYFITPEIVFQKLYTATLFSVGLMGAFNLNRNMMESTYTSVNGDGDIISQSKLLASGSYVGLNIRFHVSMLYKDKKEKPPKAQRIKNDTSATIVKIIENIDKPEVDTVCLSVNGRDFKISHSMEIKNRDIKVKVWDNKEVDGDSIHLLFNETWVLKNYGLVKRPKIIELQLKEGVNNLVLYALNLGRYPPNTAAVAIYDGKRWHQIELESTLENCGTLQILYSP